VDLQVFTNEATKLSRLEEHLCRVHPEKADNPREFFQTLKEECTQSNLPSLFATMSENNNNKLIASCNVSLLIAKSGHFITGEKLIIPAVAEVVYTAVRREPRPVIKSVPLISITLTRRIDEMGNGR